MIGRGASKLPGDGFARFCSGPTLLLPMYNILLILSFLLLASACSNAPSTFGSTPYDIHFDAAMTVVGVGGVRAPSLITRSWLVTPASFSHRAGKSTRFDASRAYRFFLDIPVRRGLDPYHVRSRKFTSSARASAASSSSTIPHISLHIAAAASGKRQKFQNTYEFDPTTQDALGLQAGRNHQEVQKSRPSSGEDAFFVAKVGKETNMTAFGILDGVGGWTSHGVDPADFSHGLATHMAKIALNWNGSELKPKELLEVGYQKTLTDPSIAAGGTTACVAVANMDGRMQIANLGDSGFIQLRGGAVHHYSNPQTHAFNTPYQLSITPPRILARAEIFGGIPLNDAPDKADLQDHMLRHGDVLVLATDGVWDNLSSGEVLNIVSNEMRLRGAWRKEEGQGFVVTDKIASLTRPGQAKTLQGIIAAAIVAEAKAASHNEQRDGPFAKEASRFYPHEPYHGGKVDDISVVVVIPVDSNKVDGSLKAKL
jgi:protein phosphatase PTC7